MNKQMFGAMGNTNLLPRTRTPSSGRHNYSVDSCLSRGDPCRPTLRPFPPFPQRVSNSPKASQRVSHSRGRTARCGPNVPPSLFWRITACGGAHGIDGLTRASPCSTFVLMEVETLGMARSLGWRVHMRCADGYRENTKSIRRCVFRKQLDLDTLVCTRGPNFPLSRLESRLMCPTCGNRRVTVVFEPPTNRQVSE
jgi:hypothetical protein